MTPRSRTNPFVWLVEQKHKTQKVTDAPNANRHFGFVDGTNTNKDYKYDTFGNMLLDRNKGITSTLQNNKYLLEELSALRIS
jgi:hypothetical protein